MTGWFNPDNWVDLISQVIMVIGAIVLGVISARNGVSLAEVKQQVKNAHTTNLRDDLDRAIRAIEALNTNVTGLRHDLRDEEERRRNNDHELRDEFERKITELNRRIG